MSDRCEGCSGSLIESSTVTLLAHSQFVLCLTCLRTVVHATATALRWPSILARERLAFVRRQLGER